MQKYGQPISGEMPAVALGENYFYREYEAGLVSTCLKYSTCILETFISTCYLPCASSQMPRMCFLDYPFSDTTCAKIGIDRDKHHTRHGQLLLALPCLNGLSHAQDRGQEIGEELPGMGFHFTQPFPGKTNGCPNQSVPEQYIQNFQAGLQHLVCLLPLSNFDP